MCAQPKQKGAKCHLSVPGCLHCQHEGLWERDTWAGTVYSLRQQHADQHCQRQCGKQTRGPGQVTGELEVTGLELEGMALY